MTASKHIDKLCIAVTALALAVTIVFLCGASTVRNMPQTMGYENRLFDPVKVHTVDIVCTDWDAFLETCENEEYTNCSVVIDGESFKNVGLRAKGNTSLSNVRQMGSSRYSFKLEFDHYQDGESYHGLDKLCLNNLIQDNTMMKDYLVYQMMGQFGAVSPLCSYVYITVNGADWGLYLAVESIEESFLQRNYGAQTGALYKPDSMSFGGGRGNGKDFAFSENEYFAKSSDKTEDATEENVQETRPNRPEAQNGQPPQMPDGMQNGQPPQMPDGMQNGQLPQMPDGMQNGQPPQMPDGMQGSQPGEKSDTRQNVKFGGRGSADVKLQYIDDDPESYGNIFDNAKTEITTADKKRLIESLKRLSSYSDLDNTVDVDAVLRYFVVHNFVCNGDSYTGSMIHNYYLREESGKLSMLPWDYNLAFGTFHVGNASQSVNASIDSPVDDGNVEDRPMVGWLFSDEQYTAQYHALFESFLESWFSAAQLETMIRETAERIRPYVEKDPTKFCTLDAFDTAVDSIISFVSLRAEAVRRQLSGDNTPIETGELNLSEMGSMGGMGGKNEPGERDGSEAERESQPDFAQNRKPGVIPEQMKSNDKTIGILLGASVFILTIGIVIAVKKKK